MTGLSGDRMTMAEEIQEYVMNLLQNLARDWDYTQPVGPSSKLFRELGLESLDVVILANAIQQHYNVQMPFAKLFAELGREQRDLTIAELAQFALEYVNGRAHQ